MSRPEAALVLDGGPLTAAEVESVARRGRRVELGDDGRRRLEAARAVVARAARGPDPVYGVNTGFGSLARRRIGPDSVREVQRNLVRSHAAGVGEPLPDDVVRAMMLILAASLARGRSGVRPEIVDRLCLMLDRDMIPIVPSRGSVGASGDLAPLAHLALTIMGEGLVRFGDARQPAMLALRQCDLPGIELEAKEGLALINGTHMMSAVAALALCDIQRLQDAAVLSAAMAVDACRASGVPLDPRLHEARNQPGQQRIAARLREALAGSEIIASHRDDDPRVQDPYCLRAMPQVLGAAFDAIDAARSAIERELGAVTDNPLVFPDGDGDGNGGDGDILSGGNFHGMPLAIAMDTLRIALTHIAGIAERRIYWLLAASDSENPVNVYLSPDPGLHSGLMIVQYTAAACCNEMQTLCTPASVANIPTSAGIEDYNSMGATSALQLRRSVALLRHVIAAELLVMAEALEYHRPLKSSEAVERAHATVRRAVKRLTADRPPAPDLAAIESLIDAGALA